MLFSRPNSKIKYGGIVKYFWLMLLIPVTVIAGGVAGTVLDDAGNPVEDVVIKFTPGKFEGLTDADGRFSIYPIKPGPKLMTVTLYGFEQYTKMFNIRDDRLDEVTVYLATVEGLPEPGRLSGKVTAIETGAPITYVTVEVLGANRAAKTGVDGTYSIDYIAPGEYEIEFNKFDYFVEISKDVVKIESGEETVLDFEMNPYETDKDW